MSNVHRTGGLCAITQAGQDTAPIRSLAGKPAPTRALKPSKHTWTARCGHRLMWCTSLWPYVARTNRQYTLRAAAAHRFAVKILGWNDDGTPQLSAPVVVELSKVAVGLSVGEWVRGRVGAWVGEWVGEWASRRVPLWVTG